MADLLQDLEDLKREAGAALAAADRREPLAAWHGEYLGRRGRLAQLMRRLAEAPAAERATLGRAANEVKRELEESYAARQEGVRQRELEAALEAERVDVTLPGRPADVGGLHPITRVLRDVGGIFGRMGFQIFDGPEVETDEYNFGLLNMPAGMLSSPKLYSSVSTSGPSKIWNPMRPKMPPTSRSTRVIGCRPPTSAGRPGRVTSTRSASSAASSSRCRTPSWRAA